MFRQILNGYSYLKSRGIIHRDLKPENILIKNKTVKIADLGMAKVVKNYEIDLVKTVCGTNPYMSPQLRRGHYRSNSEIWSLGIILFVKLYGQFPNFDNLPQNGTGLEH